MISLVAASEQETALMLIDANRVVIAISENSVSRMPKRVRAP